nr:hypothetical protein [Tanacetum cinerariifolium]
MGNNASGQARVVKCYNCQGEGYMAWQCTQPKRLRNAAWYKDKAMLAEAQKAGQILNEEQLAFLADPRVPNSQAAQTIISNNDAFQTEDLDTYDSDCDEISNANAVLMDNIFNYGSDVISEVPHFETYLNDMENQNMHAMQDFEQTPVVDVIDNEITKQMSEQIINHVNNWEKANNVGIKSHLTAVGIPTAHIDVNTAQLELVPLVYFNEKYANFEEEEPVLIHKIFLLKEMDQDSAHMVAASKVPMLKPDLDTMIMDDLYNNLKVYEPEVKGMSRSNTSTQNMAFVSSLNNSSTNGAVNTAQALNTANEVSTVSTQVNDSFSSNIDNLSDVVICAFLASQPYSP